MGISSCGAPELAFLQASAERMQRQPVPSPTFGNHCSNSCHFSFSLRNRNTRQSLLLSCPSPKHLEPSWRGDGTAAWERRGLPRCHGEIWGVRGWVLRRSPCHPGFHSWAQRAMWAWRGQWPGSQMTPGARQPERPAVLLRG